MTDLLSGLCMLVLFGLFVFFIIYALSRSRTNVASADPTERHYPRYDDDDIRSSGGFGKPAPPPNPTYDTPDINSGGSFGKPTRMKDRGQSGGPGGALGKRPASRSDDNIESSGSFGGR